MTKDDHRAKGGGVCCGRDETESVEREEGYPELSPGGSGGGGDRGGVSGGVCVMPRGMSFHGMVQEKKQ